MTIENCGAPLDVHDVRPQPTHLCDGLARQLEEAREVSAGAFERRDVPVVDLDELAAVEGRNDVVNLPESRALERVELIEVGRDTATNGLGSMQYRQW
ncbi:hypothetical protein [Bradyrhizobium sp. Cp5.3]|uniref:hypothetical protein n=1 Tax=Bradyrhizobium sp. Cp5.3 TaxID=443598 RepID=UPI0012EBF4E6|nr:hypothetical protein [Bradyrhizobium sp. Cp5.3]